MNFIYEFNSNKNEVSLLGVEGECPNELEIPEYIEINETKFKVTEILFGTLFPGLEPLHGKGVTCEVLRIRHTVNYMYFANTKIKEVVLPESLIEIPEYCFYECTKLKKVHMPNGLKSIGFCAFGGCVSLEEIIIPSTVDKIEVGCFENCSSLKEITLPIGVNVLSYSVFKNCSNLRKVITESNDVTFYPCTYQGCKKIQNINNHFIENGLLYNLEQTELYTYLGNDQNKGHIIVPASVRELANGFANSTEIISIDLSKTQIEVIYQDTFSKCANLQKVLLPNTIKSIEGRAFCDCTKLSEIYLPDSIEEISVACFKNCALKEITLPNRLKEIPQTAFNNCKELFKVDIPLSVKTINSSAFEGCDNIKQVIISKGFSNSFSTIFPKRNKIEFVFRDVNCSIVKRTGAYTYGRLRPCPYCGSDDVNTFCDGTAECNACGGKYTYQH